MSGDNRFLFSAVRPRRSKRHSQGLCVRIRQSSLVHGRAVFWREARDDCLGRRALRRLDPAKLIGFPFRFVSAFTPLPRGAGEARGLCDSTR